MKHALLYVAALLFVAGPGFAQQAPAAPAYHSAHAAPSVPKPSADQLWANLMAGNARFVAGKPQAYALASLRQKLASGQSPHVIILSRQRVVRIS
jgi:hypothetical protein